MTSIQTHQDLVDTLGESTVPYDIVKRWRREFEYGRQSCENEDRIYNRSNSKKC